MAVNCSACCSLFFLNLLNWSNFLATSNLVAPGHVTQVLGTGRRGPVLTERRVAVLHVEDSAPNNPIFLGNLPIQSIQSNSILDFSGSIQSNPRTLIDWRIVNYWPLIFSFCGTPTLGNHLTCWPGKHPRPGALWGPRFETRCLAMGPFVGVAFPFYQPLYQATTIAAVGPVLPPWLTSPIAQTQLRLPAMLRPTYQPLPLPETAPSPASARPAALPIKLAMQQKSP